MLAFPAASLPFHAVMCNGVDPAFDCSAANGIPFSPQACILHVLFASFKVRRRIPNILQARDLIPIQNLKGGQHIFNAPMPQEVNLSLCHGRVEDVPSPKAALATLLNRPCACAQSIE